MATVAGSKRKLSLTLDDLTLSSGLTVGGNISVTGTVDGRDIATDGAKLDGIEAGATADQTAAEILTAIKTVDGAASGLDADLLDGQQGSYYTDITSRLGYTPVDAAGDTLLGDLQIAHTGNATFEVRTTSSSSYDALVKIGGARTASSTSDIAMIQFRNETSSAYKLAEISAHDPSANHALGNGQLIFRTSNTGTLSDVLTLNADKSADFTGNITVTGTVDGRDVAADGSKLDGIEASADVTDAGNVNPLVDSHLNTSTAGSGQVLSWTGTDYDWIAVAGAGTVTSVAATVPTGFSVSGSPITASGTLAISYAAGYQGYTSTEASKLAGIETGATADQTASEILTAIKTVDGSGSGLDADTLDGVQGSGFLRSNTADTFTGTLTAQAPIVVDQNGNSGNIVYESSGGCYVPRPLGGSYKTTGSTATGSVAIKLPTQSWNQSDMISFHVDIYDYAGTTEGESVTLHVYGYQYTTGSWLNTGAVVMSDRTDRDYTVRFGHDGTRHIVYIGETTSSWSYPQVNVRDFQAGYSASYANYDDAFAITFETTQLNVTRTSSSNYPVSKHANNVQVDADNLTNATHYLLFTGGASGSQRANSDSGLTYNPSTNTLTTTNFAGQATTAKYADLAENYLADQAYPVGTILQIGGTAEVSIALEHSFSVVGTVSENPGYLMNSELAGEHVTPVAYIGRVPCRVKGTVRRGECLVVSDTPGVAMVRHPREILPGQLVGKALQEYTGTGEGLIEILVGRL